MNKIVLEPIGHVETTRDGLGDDYWGGQESCIVLSDRFTAAALQGIEEFSHVEVVFLFDRADPSKVVRGLRHPRNNPEWPAVGIFAQRGKDRPNHIACTICKVVRREGTRLFVSELDAVNGTPVLDIKPVLTGFLPREEVRQPAWAHEIMARYWEHKG